MSARGRATPTRCVNGYAPISDYAAIGDGRTVALVARDGSVDWLCLPDIDSPSIFAGLLDSKRGGSFKLSPDVPFDVERRYLPGTNVLETTFHTDVGAVRVTDAMTLPAAGLTPFREVARRVEGLSGCVPLRWKVEPRYGYGRWKTRIDTRGMVPVASAYSDAVAIRSWNAGKPELAGGTIGAQFQARQGDRALVALAAAHQEPLVFPNRASVEARIDGTTAFWKHWSDGCYRGPWSEAVVRSALALKLLVYAPSGTVAAAATTSLPEVIGGERNSDYRYCWIRDAAFTLTALLQVCSDREAHAFFWWFMHATQLSHPHLQVLYRMDGGVRTPEIELPLDGYQGSKPVRCGNAAAKQLQLDIYGDLMETAWQYAQTQNIDRETAHRLAEVADLVCRIWRQPDSGIWEVRGQPTHLTHSKVMCWVALDRAIRLVRQGGIPSRNVRRYQQEADTIKEFVETNCWSASLRSYTRAAGSEEMDASVLLMALMGYSDPKSARFLGTIDAVRRVLGNGPLLRRYDGADGLAGTEGFFLTCSFWLVHALALAGRLDDAARLMEELLGLANDVGLYAEELDASTGAMLGNFPQGLVHIALVNAASAIAKAAA